MAGPIKQVSSGEALSADHTNQLVNVANYALGNQSVSSATSNRGFGNLEAVVYLGKNNTETSFNKGDIVGVDDLHGQLINNTVAIEDLVLPEHYASWCVALDYIDVGGTGRVMRAGISTVTINVTDEAHNSACIADGESAAQSCAIGGHITILHKSGTGEQQCLCVYPFDVPMLMAATSDPVDGEMTVATLQSDGTVGSTDYVVNVAEDPVL